MPRNSPEVPASILWKTGKAGIRGQIISHSTNKEKKEQELAKLEQKIKQFTDMYVHSERNLKKIIKKMSNSV